MTPASQKALRQRIPRTFEAFFDRFPRLLEVQRQAIAPLVEGRSALIAAPTAGGKTEACMAPLLQRILARSGRRVEGPALLYVTPTRALVNDVYRRLQVPIDRCGLTLGRKTGDHPSLGKVLPQVLVTTPESFDSMLARAPKRLLPVRALVLDELHALDGRPRGDQLAALCARLLRIKAAVQESLQIVVMSATVDRPEDLAARYARDPIVIEDHGRRRMAARVMLSPFGLTLSDRLRQLVEGSPGKVLVFCNARADVEWAARETRGKPPFLERVYAHHGSLSKQVRERVERDFAHAKIAVCFATSTLELGIDIGDVDYAVLYGVPPDLPSFLQRVGRAGRRAGQIHFLALARDRGEILRFRHLMSAAREGVLLTDPPSYDPSTALQQAMSLLLQNPAREIAPEHVLDRLPQWQAQWWTEERLELAMQHAAEWFHRIGPGHYAPSERLEEAFRSGKLHTNIGGEPEVEVLEELTGRTLGTIAAGEDDTVLLGGTSREVKQRSDGTLVSSATSEVGAARFKRRAAPPVPMTLATDLVRWLGLDPMAIHRVESEDETIFLHGLGTVAGALLHASAGNKAIARPGRGVAFGLKLARGFQDWPAHIAEPERLRVYARDMVPRLTRLLGFGPFFRHLPAAERELAVLAAVEPERIARRLQQAKVVEVFDEELRRKIRYVVAP